MLAWILIIFMVLSSGRTDDPVSLPFSLSLFYLSRLATREHLIYSELTSLTSTTPLIEEYLKDYSESSRVRGQWEVDEHPLLVYRMIWRFVKLLPGIRNQLKNANVGIDSVKLFEEQIQLRFPVEDDLDIAALAIIDVQSNFRMPASELMVGKFANVETKLGLNANQSIVLAATASELGYFVEAWEWLDHLEGNLPGVDTDFSRRIQDIRKNLTMEHDLDHPIKLKEGDSHIFKEPLGHRTTTSPTSNKDKEMNSWLTTGSESGLITEHFYKNYALCINSSLILRKRSGRQLNCWLEKRKHFYFILSPLKSELLSLSPEIVIVHDVVGDEMMKKIWNASSQGLERDAQFPNKKSHVTNLCFLDATTLGNYATLFTKLEMMTGLNMKNSDTLRMSQYLLSGNAGVHHDAHNVQINDGRSQTFGNRLATIILYMNSIALGGELVFPMLDLMIKPVKGDVIFWYNYKRNGNIDWRVRHGVCPPILGLKRIATTFVGIMENVFKRGCSLNKFE